MKEVPTHVRSGGGDQIIVRLACSDSDLVVFVVFATPPGRLLDGDQILLALALHFKEAGRIPRSAIVALQLAFTERGIMLRRTHVGHTHVAQMMGEYGIALGGEPSGNIIFSDVWRNGDSIVTLIEVLSMLNETNRTLDDLADALPMFPSRTLEVPSRSAGRSNHF